MTKHVEFIIVIQGYLCHEMYMMMITLFTMCYIAYVIDMLTIVTKPSTMLLKF